MTSDQPTDVRSEALRLLSSGLYVLTSCAEDSIHAAGFAIESLDKQYLGGGFRFATYFYRGVARKA